MEVQGRERTLLLPGETETFELARAFQVKVFPVFHDCVGGGLTRMPTRRAIPPRKNGWSIKHSGPMHCSVYDIKLCHDLPYYYYSRIGRKCLCLTNLKFEISTNKTAIYPLITEVLNKGHGKFPPPQKKAAGCSRYGSRQ